MLMCAWGLQRQLQTQHGTCQAQGGGVLLWGPEAIPVLFHSQNAICHEGQAPVPGPGLAQPRGPKSPAVERPRVQAAGGQANKWARNDPRVGPTMGSQGPCPQGPCCGAAAHASGRRASKQASGQEMLVASCKLSRPLASSLPTRMPAPAAIMGNVWPQVWKLAAQDSELHATWAMNGK